MDQPISLPLIRASRQDDTAEEQHNISKSRQVRMPALGARKTSVNSINHDQKLAEQTYRVVVDQKTLKLTEVGVSACRHLGITLE
jgi:hypothetical protein